MPKKTALHDALFNAHHLVKEVVNLFVEDYKRKDMNILPVTSSSLIGSSGEFILFQFVESPAYFDFKRMVKEISVTTEALVLMTPEKMLINWIVDIVGWVESLKVAAITSCNKSRSTNRFSITSKAGRKLLKDGFESLLGMSEDVKRFFLKLKISVLTNQHTKKMSVTVGKDCTYRSIGIYMLRWTVLCFNCFQRDMLQLDEWTIDVRSLLGGVRTQNLKSLEKKVQQAQYLHWKARYSLMVSPDKDLSMKLSMFLENRSHHVEKKRKNSLNFSLKNKKIKYTNEENTVNRRFDAS